MPRAFDRYMVAHGAGHHLKFRAFTPAEKCAHFLGVLSIASQAPVRGAFTVGERPATAEDVAWEAGVNPAAARSALRKLRELGVLRMDDELGREIVHDWDEINPAPKRKPSDEPEQTRQRKRAQRERDDELSRQTVTPPVTPPVTPVSRPVTPPEVRRGKEEEGTTSLRSVGARERAAELEQEDRVPDDLPEPLRPIAEHVHRRLSELASARGVDAPPLRRVGGYVRDFPDHDHRVVVTEVVDYWLHGGGARTERKDFGRVYLDRLKHTVARPSHLRPVGGSASRASADDAWNALLAKHGATDGAA